MPQTPQKSHFHSEKYPKPWHSLIKPLPVNVSDFISHPKFHSRLAGFLVNTRGTPLTQSFTLTFPQIFINFISLTLSSIWPDVPFSVDVPEQAGLL